MSAERELIRELLSIVQDFATAGAARPYIDKQIAKADAYLATPEVGGLAPIERNEVMDRSYIPLPGGWEIQTKGNGSSFRLYDGRNDFRLPIADQPYLFDMLERMARDIHAAFTTPCPHIATSREGTSYCRLAESDAKDAARYRWLRGQMFVSRNNAVPDRFGLLRYLLSEGIEESNDSRYIDAAIDASLNQPEKSP